MIAGRSVQKSSVERPPREGETRAQRARGSLTPLFVQSIVLLLLGSNIGELNNDFDVLCTSA
jgi:hypothetical protein